MANCDQDLLISTCCFFQSVKSFALDFREVSFPLFFCENGLLSNMVTDCCQ